MSLFNALNVSLTGLRTVTGQMQLVADNISNANTAGYTKKTAQLKPVLLGDQPGGSQIVGYARATNDGVTRTLRDATTEAGLRSAQDGYLQDVQNILGNDTSTPALATALTKFTSAWAEMAAEPESTVQQRAVVQAGKVLADTVQSTANKVESLDRQVLDDVNNALATLNTSLQKVAALNLQIASGITLRQPIGGLEDERDQILLDIAKITNIQVMQRDRGQIAIATKSGYMLLDVSSYKNLNYDGINVTTNDNPSLSLNTILTGGSLQASVDFRTDNTPSSVSAEAGSEVIRKLRSQLDSIVNAFTSSTTGQFAATYDGATTNTGELASGFFTGTDRTNFAVNSALIAGTSVLKQQAAKSVTDMFNLSNQAFAADGLSLTNANYNDLVPQILTNFQQSANNVSQLAKIAASQATVLNQRLANATGVNTDSELVALTSLQNAYSASAKVISVINSMFDTLDQIVR
jgi:flagellar hook-associated protein 1 FlgK